MDALESDRETTTVTWSGGGRAQRLLVGVVVTGAVVIAAIGFAGSYAAVRALAVAKGFGAFAPFFPIGIDAGIVVLLALDLLLTWIRIPFPLLRQTAWLLTAATIAFNGAAAWPDPLGVGMHAVIPVLFVVAVEAARHAIGRIADITADRHMEGVRVARWLLAFPSTFRLWRRMKLWELRSYDQVIRMEQDRLVYEARLRARFGRGWRRKAPVEALMPLRLARFGVPLAETGPAGLASAGITEPLRLAEPGPALPKSMARNRSPEQQEEGEDLGREPEVEPVREQPLTSEMPASASLEDQDLGAAPERAGTSAFVAEAEVAEKSASPVDSAAETAEHPPAQSMEQRDDPGAVSQLYADAFQAFTDRHGDWPNARQFGLFLADVYGVTDPDTLGPLPEAALRPVLAELRAAHPAVDAAPVQSAHAEPLPMADERGT